MLLILCIFCKLVFILTPRVLSPFRGGGIAHLNDPDSYAGWSFYTPVRATQARLSLLILTRLRLLYFTLYN